MDGFHDAMAIYAHNHTLNQTQLDGIYGGPILKGSPQFKQDSMQGLLTSLQPNMVPPALPIIFKLISDFTRLKNMRILNVNGPMYQILIGDNQYVDQVETIDCEFDLPAMTIQDRATNLFEIYEERMIEHFKNEFVKYLNSVPNADTLVVFSLGELFVVSNMDKQMNPKTTVKFRFRVRAFEDATYIPKKEEAKPSVVEHKLPKTIILDGSTKGKPDIETIPVFWTITLDKEPGRFKRWIATLLFGSKFKKIIEKPE